MQISLFGRTDKRTCLYTLMKILEPMGDVCLVTPNPNLRRLTEDGESYGFYKNIAIFVTEATADEMWRTIGHMPDDFEYVILDGLYNENTDLVLYVQGAGVEALDESLLETFEDIQVIKMGKGKDAVPYSNGLMAALEHIEYFKQLVVPSPAMLNKLAKLLSPHIGMTPQNIVKGANRK